MDEAPYSSSFTLFKDSLRIHHTIRSDESAGEHAALLADFLSAALADGQSIREGGLEEGQETEEITGYVVMETTNGDKVLYLYGHAKLEKAVRGGRVYEEKFAELPFKPDLSKIFEGQSPPTRPYAIEKGYFREQHCKLVRVKTEQTTDLGKPIYRCVKVIPSGAPVTSSPPPASGDQELCDKITRYLQAVETLQALTDGALQAFKRKPDLGPCWDQVQRTVRLALVRFSNNVISREGADELKATVKSIGKVLPDGYADELCKELDARSFDSVAF